MKKIINILTTTFLVFLLVIGAFVAISLIPIKGNYKVLTVMSGSMNPTIPTGSLIVIKPFSDYKIGDIVTFKTHNSQYKNDLTTHRIIGTDERFGEKVFFTKGDANESEDSTYLTSSEILGKVLFSVALIGYIVGYAKTLPGLVIIIVLATIIVYEEVKKIRSEVKRIRELKKTKTKKQTNKKINKNKKRVKGRAGKDDKKN